MNRHARHGSVLLLVVGLLTIIGMLGGTFLLVARMNQRTSRSLRDAAPPDAVAEGILQRLLTDRTQDLFIRPDPTDPTNFNKDILYGNIQFAEEAIDYPNEWIPGPSGGTIRYDRSLANIEPDPYETGGDVKLRWRHLSHLPGSLEPVTKGFLNPTFVENVYALDADTTTITDTAWRRFADTDGMTYRLRFDENGDGDLDDINDYLTATNDAPLVASGIYDRNGNEYLVAVRMIDASGLVNVNTALWPQSADVPVDAAAPGKGYRPMGACNVSLLQQLYSSYTDSSLVHADAADAAYDAMSELDTQRRRNNSAIEYQDFYSLRPLAPTVHAPANGANPPLLPYDTADALAMLCRNNDTQTGRVAGEIFAAAEGLATPAGSAAMANRPLMTTWSASRMISPPFDIGGTTNHKVDLNLGIREGTATAAQKEAALRDLWSAFYKAVPREVQNLTDGTACRWQGGGDDEDLQRRMWAAQMAVNVWDYVDDDADGEPSRLVGIPDSGGSDIQYKLGGATATVYGVERQPFITEVAYTSLTDTEQYYAIELYNPYDTAINIENYVLKRVDTSLPTNVATTIVDDWSSVSNQILPGHFIVIVSNETLMKVDTTNADVIPVAGLVLPKDEEIRLNREMPTGEEIMLDRFRMDGAGVTFAWEEDPTLYKPDASGLGRKGEALRRGEKGTCKDSLPNAMVLVPGTPPPPPPPPPPPLPMVDLTSDPATNPVINNLGLANEINLTSINECPVFVRNNRFVNIGELVRILHVGPDLEDLTTTGRTAFTTAADRDYYNGRVWNNFGIRMPSGTDIHPAVPLLGLLSECLSVDNLRYDGGDNNDNGTADEDREAIAYGKVNINTATFDTLRSLPPLAAMAMDFATTKVIDPANAGAGGGPGGGPYVRDALAREIMAYRDMTDNVNQLGGAYPLTNVPGTGGGKAYESNANGRRLLGGQFAQLRNEPGYAAGGEVQIPLWKRLVGSADPDTSASPWKLPQESYGANRAPFPYELSNGTDDGLPSSIVTGDQTKGNIYYAWMSNQITVRSDTYIAYIYVQDPMKDPYDPKVTPTGRRYVALIDRSGCWQRGEQPRVLMFTRVD